MTAMNRGVKLPLEHGSHGPWGPLRGVETARKRALKRLLHEALAPRFGPDRITARRDAHQPSLLASTLSRVTPTCHGAGGATDHGVHFVEPGTLNQTRTSGWRHASLRAAAAVGRCLGDHSAGRAFPSLGYSGDIGELRNPMLTSVYDVLWCLASSIEQVGRVRSRIPPQTPKHCFR